MRNLFPVLFLITIALAPSCKKPELPIVYVQKEMLEYCWFPDGSYWIYEEENTPGLIDSVYSAGAKSGFYVDEYDDSYQAQYFAWQLNSPLNTYWQTIIAWGIPPDFEHSYSEMTEFYLTPGPGIDDIVLFWDSRNRDILPSYPYITITERYDSILIGGKIYPDAVEVSTTPPEAAEHTYQTIWARGVGIIQRKTRNGEVWNLVRHRINR